MSQQSPLILNETLIYYTQYWACDSPSAQMARAEVGLKDRTPAPTLAEVANLRFLPYVVARRSKSLRRSLYIKLAWLTCSLLKNSGMRGWTGSMYP